jgi:hypothetical protein
VYILRRELQTTRVPVTTRRRTGVKENKVVY